MNLQGKSVLITGGSKRAGAVISEKLASAGCRVIVHCRKIDPEAEKFTAALPGEGHRLLAADLADEAAVRQLAAEAGNFDLLVNCAALFYRPGSPEDIAASELYHRVNFRAPEILLEEFFTSGRKSLAAVNITDSSALRPGSGAYYESKWKLNELTVKLAEKWAERDCRINAVAPGPMIPPPWAPASRMEKTLPLIPLHRPAALSDLADLTAFLLQCDSMTGAVIPLDCGMSVL